MGHQYRIPLSPDGMLLLPEEVRQQLHLQGGDVVIVREEDGRFVLESDEDPVSRAQAIVRSYIGDVRGAVDDFIATRRVDSGE